MCVYMCTECATVVDVLSDTVVVCCGCLTCMCVVLTLRSVAACFE